MLLLLSDQATVFWSEVLIFFYSFHFFDEISYLFICYEYFPFS